jgi:hypothetical protein
VTAVAYIGQTDLLRRYIDFWVGHRTDQCIIQTFGDGTRETTFVGRENDTESSPRPSFSLDEDEARALLQALVRHFDGGEDTRSLRKDYDAERKRVDLLIDKLANTVVVQAR